MKNEIYSCGHDIEVLNSKGELSIHESKNLKLEAIKAGNKDYSILLLSQMKMKLEAKVCRSIDLSNIADATSFKVVVSKHHESISWTLKRIKAIVT